MWAGTTGSGLHDITMTFRHKMFDLLKVDDDQNPSCMTEHWGVVPRILMTWIARCPHGRIVTGTGPVRRHGYVASSVSHNEASRTKKKRKKKRQRKPREIVRLTSESSEAIIFLFGARSFSLQPLVHFDVLHCRADPTSASRGSSGFCRLPDHDVIGHRSISTTVGL